MVRPLDTDLLIDGVCAYYRMQLADVLGTSKQHRFTRPRWLIIRFMRDQGMPLTEIGIEIGRDHTTILNALRKFDERFTTEEVDEVWQWVKEYHDKRALDD